MLAGLRLQDRGGAVPHVGAGRLPGRADPGDRVPLGRLEGGGLRAADPLLLSRALAAGARRALAARWAASTGRSSCWCICDGDHDARQPRGAQPAEREAPARLLEHRARRLHADGLRRAERRRACARCSSTWSTYYLMNLGAFLVVMVVANSTGREDLDGFRGLAWRGGAVPAVAMAIFLFSLAGLPPLAGFVGKFYLFAAVVEQQLYLLALVGVAEQRGRRSTTTRASSGRCSSIFPPAAIRS